MNRVQKFHVIAFIGGALAAGAVKNAEAEQVCVASGTKICTSSTVYYTNCSAYKSGTTGCSCDCSMTDSVDAPTGCTSF